jgi:hypothetical protein
MMLALCRLPDYSQFLAGNVRHAQFSIFLTYPGSYLLVAFVMVQVYNFQAL